MNKVRGLENLSQIRVLDTYLVGHKGFIAGGCFKNIFNGEKFKDIDIFFKNSIDFAEASSYFSNHENYYHYYENKKVISYKNRETGIAIELIRTVYGTPEQIINDFDFTITKFAYYNETVVNEETKEESVENKVVHNEDYFEHLYFKRLVLDDKIPFPISTFERSYRYKGYGYSLCKESKAKLIEAIKSNTTPNDELSRSLYDGLD